MTFNVLTEKTLFTGVSNKKVFKKGSKIKFRMAGSNYCGEIVEIGSDWFALMMITKEDEPFIDSMIVRFMDIEEDSCNYAV